MHKADEFLIFVAKNEKRLKKNLRKNITFDNDLFDDVYSESILKCYETIKKKNLDIEDFERYFFIASKFNYINTQNKIRRRKKITAPIDEAYNLCEFDREFELHDEPADIKKVNRLKSVLSEVFGVDAASLFMLYYTMKTTGGTNYKEVADEANKTVDEVSATIRTIKEYIQKNRNAIYQ